MPACRRACRPLIAHAVHRFDIGGMENGVVNLINRLPPDFADHAVIAFTTIDPAFARRIERTGVTFIELHKPPGQTARILGRLWSNLRRLRPSVLHTRNLATLEGQLAAWAAGIPIRIHGEHGWDIGDLDGSNRRMLRLRQCLRGAVQHQIALSAHTRRYLVDQVGVPCAQVSQICNGVDTDRFQPLADEARRATLLLAAGLPPDAFVVGALGRLAAVKNLPLLVQAFAIVRQRNPAFRQRARLAFVGEGPDLNRLGGELAKYDLIDSTWLPGARDDVPACLQRFSVLCLPSLAEGISNTVLEAMACGLPVIASAVGGNGELVEPGQTGYLIESGDVISLSDHIETYFDDQALRNRHARHARQQAVARFALQTMVERYQSVYTRLLRRQG